MGWCFWRTALFGVPGPPLQEYWCIKLTCWVCFAVRQVLDSVLFDRRWVNKNECNYIWPKAEVQQTIFHPSVVSFFEKGHWHFLWQFQTHFCGHIAIHVLINRIGCPVKNVLSVKLILKTVLDDGIWANVNQKKCVDVKVVKLRFSCQLCHWCTPWYWFPFLSHDVFIWPKFVTTEDPGLSSGFWCCNIHKCENECRF